MKKSELRQIIREEIEKLNEYNEKTYVQGDIEVMINVDSKMLDAYTYKDMKKDLKRLIPNISFKPMKNNLFLKIIYDGTTNEFIKKIESKGMVDLDKNY